MTATEPHDSAVCAMREQLALAQLGGQRSEVRECLVEAGVGVQVAAAPATGPQSARKLDRVQVPGHTATFGDVLARSAGSKDIRSRTRGGVPRPSEAVVNPGRQTRRT